MVVKTAFLHGFLNRGITWTNLKGFVNSRIKCVYWKNHYMVLKSHLGSRMSVYNYALKLGFNWSMFNAFLYFKSVSHILVFLLSFIDDILMSMIPNMDVICKIKRDISTKFEMTDLGESSMILGMNIIKDRKNSKSCIDQKEYIIKILKIFYLAWF